MIIAKAAEDESRCELTSACTQTNERFCGRDPSNLILRYDELLSMCPRLGSMGCDRLPKQRQILSRGPVDEKSRSVFQHLLSQN